MAEGDLKTKGPKPKERFVPEPSYRKVCNVCRRRRYARFFHKRAASFDGLAFTCIDCVREYNQERMTDEDFRKDNRRRALAWQATHPEHRRRQMRKVTLKRYGLTEEQYEEMLSKQNGVCAVCKESETTVHHRSGEIRRLSIDHDHETGEVRALLCRACNLAIGVMNEDAHRASAVARYLRRWGR